MTIDNSPTSRVLGALADLLRAAVLVGVVVAAASSEVEGSIRLGLVFLILLAPRLAHLPKPFDLAVCLLVPSAALASIAHWYQQVWWLDWVMHCFTTGSLAAMFYLLLLRTSLLAPLRHRHRASITLFTVMLGLSAGVLWEFYEWFAEAVAGVEFGVSYDDTIADLAMDGLGSLLAGLALTIWIALDTTGHGDRLADQDAGGPHDAASTSPSAD